MAVKLFVTDLDGTLLPTGRKVSAENIKAAQEAVAQGVVVTIATGRMYQAAFPVAQALGVDVPIITYNGALIKSVAGEILYASYLEPELVQEVLDFCEGQGWYVQLYSDDTLYYAEQNEKAKRYEQAQLVQGIAVGREGLREHLQHVAKLLLVSDSMEETQARIAGLRKQFAGRLDCMSSNAYYTEVVNPGVSKAAAIGRLAEKLGIDIADTMAIGDSDNDLPMLKAAGKSIAMGNAVPAVKEVCDYETGTCEEDGFAQAVRQYVLKK